MATDQNYYVDVLEEDGEEIYDAILRAIPKPTSPVPSGQKFTRISITKAIGLPKEHDSSLD